MTRWLLLVLAAVAAAAGRAGLGAVTDCSGGRAVVKWKSMVMQPDPPVRGEEVGVRAKGVTSKSIVKGGTGTLRAKLGGLQIFSSGIQTCGETDIALPGGLGNATFKSLECPTKGRGNVSAWFAMVVPATAPSGTYDVRGWGGMGGARLRPHLQGGAAVSPLHCGAPHSTTARALC